MSHKNACQETCGLARAAGIVGENWTLLILRQIMFLGQSRFDEIQNSLGISRHLLSTRLKRLVEEGILEHRDEGSGSYVLTQKGEALFPVMAALLKWGEAYSLKKREIPVTSVHSECEHQTDPRLTCSHCEEELTLEQFELVPKSR